jgi:hypothetical protein
VIVLLLTLLLTLDKDPPACTKRCTHTKTVRSCYTCCNVRCHGYDKLSCQDWCDERSLPHRERTEDRR